MYRKRRSFSQSSLPVTWTQLVQLKSGCARGHDIHKLEMGFELCTHLQLGAKIVIRCMSEDSCKDFLSF
jgi:hypothetical protein